MRKINEIRNQQVRIRTKIDNAILSIANSESYWGVVKYMPMSRNPDVISISNKIPLFGEQRHKQDHHVFEDMI